MQQFRVWSNHMLPDSAQHRLQNGVRRAGGELIIAARPSRSNLETSPRDPLLDTCDIAFGQPDVQDLMRAARVKWVHLSSAGYTKYDNPELSAAIRSRAG